MIKNKFFESAEIVLVPFPYSDLSSLKTRPALIIKYLGNDLIVAAISSKSGEKYFEKITNLNLMQGKLPLDSFVRYSKIITISSDLVKKSVAKLESECFKKIIKRLLELLND